MRDTSFNFSTKDSQKPKVYQGGEIKVMKKSLSLLLAIAMVFTMFASVAFAAEDTGKTALDKFNELKEKGIIEGHANGTAGLDENMTRAQAAVVLTKLFGLDQENPATASFSDVPKTHWAYKFVEAAVKAGFINGLGNGKFAPSSDVTTQDLSVMVVLALGLETDANATVSGNVKDYAKKYVAAAIANGLLASQADYTKPALRSQLVEVAYSADQVLNPVVTEPAVASAAAKTNTTVEVVFDKELTATDKADYTFDNNLTVSAAELQADKKTVKLTTSAQTKDQVYKLSYKGKDTGKTVTGIQIVRVTITPVADETLPHQSVKAYTAKFVNEDGSIYTGKVGIALVEDDSYNLEVNTNVKIESVGSTSGLNVTSYPTFAGVTGQVTFTVRGVAANSSTRAVAWIDVNNDNDFDTVGNGAPTEPYAIAGKLSFSGAAAATGNYTDVTVDSLNKSSKYFVGTDLTPATNRFNWDSNDIFQISGNLKTLEEFEAALSEGDVLSINYDADAADVSIFNMTTNNTATALKVTAPTTTVDTNSTSYVITGTGQAGYVVSAHVENANGGTFVLTDDPKVAEATIAADGTWSLAVPLAVNAASKFYIAQRETAGTTVPTAGAKVVNINQGTAGEFKITTAGATLAGATLTIGDTIDLVFSKDVYEIKSGTTLKITDSDGTVAKLIVGTNVSAALTAPGDYTGWTLTLDNGFPIVEAAGSAAGISSPSILLEVTGIVDSQNNPVKIGDAVLD